MQLTHEATGTIWIRNHNANDQHLNAEMSNAEIQARPNRTMSPIKPSYAHYGYRIECVLCVRPEGSS